MRSTILILTVLLLAGGCAARQPPAQTGEVEPEPRFDSAVAAALVFDPPVRAGEPLLDLSRSNREPSAFVSYEDLQVTSYYLHIDDRQNFSGNGDFGRFERRAITQTIGVSYR